MINASSEGSIIDMTSAEIRILIEKLAIESKHSTNDEEWYADQPRGVKEFINAHHEYQHSELTKAILLLKKEKRVEAKVKIYMICLKNGHTNIVGRH